ncbi:hypothetical protein AAVH_42761, partial [Aphelenchoides avenae]
MSDMRREMEEGLKPGTVNNLLEKCAILRSIIEEATKGNVAIPQSFFDAHNVSTKDVEHHLKDIPKLEKEFQKLSETVDTMAKQRSA